MTKEKTKLTLNNVLLASHPSNLIEAKSFKGVGKPQFWGSFLVKKETQAHKLLQDGYAKQGIKPTTDQLTVWDLGKAYESDTTGDFMQKALTLSGLEYSDFVLIKASGMHAPSVLQPAEGFKIGNVVNIAITLQRYDRINREGKDGIKAYLNAVAYVKHYKDLAIATPIDIDGVDEGVFGGESANPNFATFTPASNKASHINDEIPDFNSGKAPF